MNPVLLELIDRITEMQKIVNASEDRLRRAQIRSADGAAIYRFTDWHEKAKRELARLQEQKNQLKK